MNDKDEVLGGNEFDIIWNAISSTASAAYTVPLSVLVLTAAEAVIFVIFLPSVSRGSFIELGDGYTELTEDWAPDVQEKQYVNMKTKTNTLNGSRYILLFVLPPKDEYPKGGIGFQFVILHNFIRVKTP